MRTRRGWQPLRGVIRHRVTHALLIALSVIGARTAAAQSCATGTRNSCLTVRFTPVRLTPEPADFALGVGVLGTMDVTVLKCGRPPCELTVAAANQPPSGLRLKVGGSAPASLAECAVDIRGITSVNSSPAPTIALVNGPATIVVWVCQPLSWDPLLTPVGSWSPEFRFRLRQS